MPAMPPPSGRVVHRDGTTHATRVGFRRPLGHDVYLSLLRRSWSSLVALLFTFYLALVALFALLYLAQPGAIGGVAPGSFGDAFFFSVQTLATIGYGVFTPQTVYGHALVTIEAFVGLLATALLTGLAFAKFSRTTARVIFSERAVVGALDGRPCLMFRMANGRDTSVVEAQLRVSMIRGRPTAEGGFIRRFYELPLERAWTPVFALTWTAVHVIDEHSPLWGESAASLAGTDVEIVVSFVGIDETSSQTVHARFSYVPSEIAWNAQFVDIMEPGPDGPTVHYARLHEVVTSVRAAEPLASPP
jgi:inward rectifier potassium channel